MDIGRILATPYVYYIVLLRRVRLSNIALKSLSYQLNSWLYIG
jgi:hypothetical protein